MECIETPVGFALYKRVADDAVWLADVFVVPEARRSGAGSHLADQVCDVAREMKCKYVLTSVDPTAPGATVSMMAILSYGFNVFGNDGRLVLFKKEL